MSKGLNRIDIIGNVGQDPDSKTLESGTHLATFSVATSKTYKKQDGEKETVTQWHKVVAWRKIAEIITKYVKKGNRIMVTGEMTYRSYENEAGLKVYVAEIVASDILLLSGKPEGQNSPPPQQEPFSDVPQGNGNAPDDNDDLPF